MSFFINVAPAIASGMRQEEQLSRLKYKHIEFIGRRSRRFWIGGGGWSWLCCQHYTWRMEKLEMTLCIVNGFTDISHPEYTISTKILF